MNIEEYRDFCIGLPFVEEKMPFDDKTLVFFVCNKMFTCSDVENFDFINVKCDPEEAIELREKHPEVMPGWHMNKKHWNSISVAGNLSDEKIKHWIKNSYRLVFAKLPKKYREKLGS